MRTLGLTMALAALIGISAPAMAGGCNEQCLGNPSCCGHCGCHAVCKPMCKVVAGVKEVTKVVWEVKCEQFCIPFPGFPGCKCGRGSLGEGCGTGCDAGCCDKGNCPEVLAPECGPVRCRKVLVKKEVKVQCPTFKCVPCFGCDSCCESGAVVPPPGAGKTAPAPIPVVSKAPKST